MNGYAALFVDDGNIVIFVQNIERYVLGQSLHAYSRRYMDGYHIARFKRFAAFHFVAVDRNTAVVDKILYVRSGIRQNKGKINIEPLIFTIFDNINLIHFYLFRRFRPILLAFASP